MAERDSNQKRCCTCKEFLPRERFGPSKQRKDGLRPRCRECHRKANAESRAVHLEASRAASLRWQKNNPQKAKAKKKRWMEANPGRQNVLAGKWRRNNKDKLAEARARKSLCPNYRIMRSMSQRIRGFLSGKGGRQTQSLVGYTGQELRQHLERQFLDGMSWDNYGDWHIDHILPLSSFRAESVGDAHVRRAWALSNLRPMWARENIQKGDKILFLV